MLKITISVQEPEGFEACTAKEQEEWVKAITGCQSYLSCTNPLYEKVIYPLNPRIEFKIDVI